MSARELVMRARERLASAGVPDAAFEAELLVRNATGLTRAEYLAGTTVTTAGSSRSEAMVERRVAREPASYITGTREFWGMDFEVGPGVLVPRPETELLVELALSEARSLVRPVIVDVGTGTGCIAIALCRELKDGYVVAVDVSREALGYARRNAARHGARPSWLAGDLAAGLRHADIVLANLPYIATDEIDALEPEVSEWEPRVALDGGADGFALIRRLLGDCAGRLRPRVLAIEVGFGMAAQAAALANERGAVTTIHQDLARIDRVVCCRWP